jgi:type I restriction enzyme, S subunit
MIIKENEWKKYRFSEAFDINPKIKIKKFSNIAYVELKDIKIGFRDVSSKRNREIKGGSKFESKDILFSRISPSLENGKIARYLSNSTNNDYAFGSTEFTVIRSKKNFTDKNLTYYICKSKKVTDNAIKSMTGTSGRQRVPKDFFDNFFIKLPPLKYQEKISNLLFNIDDNINHLIMLNKKLDEITDKFFNEKFLSYDKNFSFNNQIKSEKKLPLNWKIGKIEDLGVVKKGISPKYTEDETYPILNQKCIRDNVINFRLCKFTQLNKIDENNFLKTFDVIINSMGVGTLGRVSLYINHHKKNLVDGCINFFRGNNMSSSIYVFNYLKNKEKDLINLSKGTTGQTTLDKDDIKNISIIIPDTKSLLNFTDLVKDFYFNKNLNLKKIDQLINIRDTLIEKILSEKI